MYGSNYVPMPYSPVEAYSASNDAVIPSGGTAVGGVYYEWNDSGFIGKGWFTDIETGPMGKFENDQAVIDYLDKLAETGQDRNLNLVFSEWQDFLKGIEISNPDLAFEYMESFRKRVLDAGGSGCVHL